MTTAPLLRPERPAERTLTDEPALRVGLAGFVLFAVTGAVVAIDPPDAVGTALFLAVAVLMCTGLTATGAAGIGIATWAFVEGFVLHDDGQLGLGPVDLWLLVAAVLVCLAPSVLRRPAGGAGRSA